MNALIICSGVGVAICSCKSDKNYMLLNMRLDAQEKLIKIIRSAG
jgi:hypothetical protein